LEKKKKAAKPQEILNIAQRMDSGSGDIYLQRFMPTTERQCLAIEY